MTDDKKKPADDGLVSVRFKSHARGVNAGALKRVDAAIAKELVDNGHAKYVGAEKH